MATTTAAAAAASLLPPALKPGHFFLVPLPTQGHVAPLLQLAHHLASLGFFVTFVTPDTVHSRLLERSNSNQSGSVNPYPGIQLLPVSDGMPADKVDLEVLSLKSLIGMVEVMKTGVELLIRKLKKEEPPVTCFIADEGVLWAQDVADRVGVPRVAFWPMSASFYSVVYNVPLLASNGYIPYTEELADSEDIITCIPGLAPVLRAADLPLSDTVYQLACRLSATRKAAAAIIFHSIYELESNTIDVLRQELPIYTVGPLLPLDPNGRGPRLFHEDEACLQWLNTRDPSTVLYVSFGSTGSYSEAELKELALGLEASEQPFLWVIRPTLVAQDSTFSISDIFSAQTKHRSMVISWAPQLSVLQHPSVGGFLTHCGWNSVIESIYTGVPMIGRPKAVADQMIIRRLISEEWKIGISLGRPNEGPLVRRGAIEKAVRALFNGEEGKEARRRVAELRKILTTAAGDGGSLKKNLVDFVNDMTKRAKEATD